MFPKGESLHGSQPARLPSVALLLKACLPFMVRCVSPMQLHVPLFLPPLFTMFSLQVLFSDSHCTLALPHCTALTLSTPCGDSLDADH